MKMPTLKAMILSSVFLAPYALYAQSESTPTAETEAATTEEAALMTPEELQTLVGPVALYPDTLLIQILVAATYPLDVIKADRLLKDNVDTDAEALKGEIDAQGWDESVTVLATAFPDVLSDMAANIDWTETLGNAMLAQDQDVMDSIQTMREIANDNGALQSGDEQIVEVTQEQNGDQTIIIQPADPQVVYVPEYKTETVYVQSTSSGIDAGDAVAAGLIAFGTFVVMDAIFNNNDPWHGYWGCRNCGGWHGRPVVINPRNVNINGNVNIGNNVGWKAAPRRQEQARTQISRRSGPNGTRPVPVKRSNRGDSMRSDLSRRSGAADISRRDNPAAGVNRPAKTQRPATQRPAAQRPAAQRPSAGQRPAAQRAITGNRGSNAAVNRTAAPAKARAPVKKPKAARAAPARAPSKPRGGAMNNRAAAPKARSGGSRGRASSGGGRRR
ncbi:MAG: hypothetical protein COC12_08640 [Rhodobacteraceae bacterium]|nr:MAG: hypothetical protein COC12_08640 [Paracoccaceae bacterium]